MATTAAAKSNLVTPRATTTQKPPPSNLATTAADAKRIAAFAQYGKSLFTNEINYLSAAQLAFILKQCGVDVPKGVIVTAEVAQMIAAGGSFVNAVNVGASTAQCVMPAAAAIRAAASILQSTGIIKAASVELDLLMVGVDVCLIIGSCGTNVMAWVMLAMDIYKTVLDFGTGALAEKAKSDAMRQAYAQYQAQEQLQYANFTNNLADYQNGKIGAFDFIDQAAADAPDYFSRAFPQLTGEVPDVIKYITVTAKATAHKLGIKQSRSYTYMLAYHTIDYSQQMIARAIFDYYVAPAMRPYISFDHDYPQTFSMKDAVLLSSVPPYLATITQAMDMAGYLKSAQCTPNDFGSKVISTGVQTGAMFTTASAQLPQFTFNGVDYFNPQQNIVNAQNAMAAKDKAIILAADQAGDAKTLFSYPAVVDHVNKWAEFPFKQDDAAAQTLLGSFFGGGDASLAAQQANYAKGLWMNPQQLITAMHTLKDMKDANVFKNFNYSPQELFNWFTSIDEFEKRHRDLTYLLTAKAANYKAKETIAYYLGTTADNIEPAAPITQGKPTVWKVKK